VTGQEDERRIVALIRITVTEALTKTAEKGRAVATCEHAGSFVARELLEADDENFRMPSEQGHAAERIFIR
jgi:hypothetical protein